MTAREELARLLFITDNSGARDPEAEWEAARPSHRHYAYELADALLPLIAQERAEALTEAAAALELQPPKLRAQYVATLRLYAAEPWRLLNTKDPRP